jgi:PhnB protein
MAGAWASGEFTMKAYPYLFFGGNCAEVIDFYRDALGADVRALVRFRDMPGTPPDAGDHVAHAELDVGGTPIFASDGGRRTAETAGFAISLQVADDDEAERVFAVLAQDGAIEIPLMTTPFASRFGKATDRYGATWMITTPQPAL